MKLPLLAIVIFASALWIQEVQSKKPSRPVPSRSRPQSRPSRSAAPKQNPPRKRYEEQDDDDDPINESDPLDEEEEEEEVIPSRLPPRRKPTPKGPASNSRTGPPPSRKRPPVAQYDDEDDDYEDEEEKEAYIPPRRGAAPRPTDRPAFARRPNRRPPGGGRSPGGRVVPYAQRGGPNYGAVLAQSWSGLVKALPDPSIVKEAALSGIQAAQQTTSNLSANIYREVKGLTSSELEQVMLKATRPDDTAVKGKHVERLVGVTYQISARYDIYDAVLRKLWSKMVEKDWRTTIKALYILHRFAADGSPEHAPALKARLRELRRTRDPKRKDKFFNSKQLLAGDASPETIQYRAFMSRYAHFVLLRTQCFSGMFEEISAAPKPDKKGGKTKPITATALRVENLNSAEMILKTGLPCQLKDGEECENTAIAAERVVSDLIGLTSAVAMALNRALKDEGDLKGADPALLKKWCVFYKEQLLPQTKAMIKKASPKLDAYGLFLPSRMGTSVAPDVLERGLNLEEKAVSEADEEDEEVGDAATAVSEPREAEPVDAAPKAAATQNKVEKKESATEKPKEQATAVKEEAEEEEGAEEEDDDEYEYEEEEYYEDEEEA
jgi:ANTH domain